MRESAIETALVRLCEQRGWLCRKWVSPGRRGVPDRIILAQYPVMAFVETKAPEGCTTSWQDREHERLRAQGYQVFVLFDHDSMWYLMKLLERQVSALKPKKPKPKPKPGY